MNISFETSREQEDDRWEHTAIASRGGLFTTGSGYTQESAMDRAKRALISAELNLSPVSANWENTPEAMLCRG